MTQNFKLLPATVEHCEAIWLIANQADVRAASFSKRPIQYLEHQAWYQAKLTEEHSRFYIIEVTDGVAGYIRFDADEYGNLITSIALERKFRGQGLGKSALQKALLQVRVELDAPIIRSQVINGNESSLSLFQACGFHGSDQNGTWMLEYAP